MELANWNLIAVFLRLKVAQKINIGLYVRMMAVEKKDVVIHGHAHNVESVFAVVNKTSVFVMKDLFVTQVVS